MTDNEIIKALECCNKEDPCGECPLFKTSYPLCVLNLNAEAYNLINRQKAEIETLKNNCNSMYKTMPNMAKAERAEAIREFAEKLKANMVQIRCGGHKHNVITEHGVDYYVKEMECEDND